MSTELIITALAITWGAIAFLFALILRHMSTCNKREREMGTMFECLHHIRKQLGDQDSGLIRSLHDFKLEIRTVLYAKGHER